MKTLSRLGSKDGVYAALLLNSYYLYSSVKRRAYNKILSPIKTKLCGKKMNESISPLLMTEESLDAFIEKNSKITNEEFIDSINKCVESLSKDKNNKHRGVEIKPCIYSPVLSKNKDPSNLVEENQNSKINLRICLDLSGLPVDSIPNNRDNKKPRRRVSASRINLNRDIVTTTGSSVYESGDYLVVVKKSEKINGIIIGFLTGLLISLFTNYFFNVTGNLLIISLSAIVGFLFYSSGFSHFIPKESIFNVTKKRNTVVVKYRRGNRENRHKEFNYQ